MKIKYLMSTHYNEVCDNIVIMMKPKKGGEEGE